MNKEELLKLLESFNFPREEYYVLGGSCLVIYGIRNITRDLDLCVSYELFNVIKQKYNLKDDDKNESGFYKISDLVEIVPNEKKDFNMQCFEGYQLEDLYQMYMYKQKRNKTKDIMDLENIRNFIINSQDKDIQSSITSKKLIDMGIDSTCYDVK